MLSSTHKEISVCHEGKKGKTFEKIEKGILKGL